MQPNKFEQWFIFKWQQSMFEFKFFIADIYSYIVKFSDDYQQLIIHIPYKFVELVFFH